jgi:hypothetical protein
MLKARPLLCLLLLLTGCAGRPYAEAGAQTQFAYDLWLPGHSRAELWQGTRDYFASAYHSDELAFDVLNPEQGSMVGHGELPWHLADGAQCRVRYQIQLAVLDDRTRLRFSPALDDISGDGDCSRWRRISRDGYREMQAAFTQTAAALQTRLGGPKVN